MASLLMLILRINLLVTISNCFNVSSFDKDELWHLLLNRQISQNDSNALYIEPPSNYGNVRDNGDIVHKIDKVNEFSHDNIGSGFNDGEVKVEYNDRDENDENQNKIVDKNLESRFMDIFNVSVIDVNETADTFRNNISDAVNVHNNEPNTDDNLSDVPYVTDNLSYKRDEYALVTPSVIAIDVFKPSETDLDNDEEIEIFKLKTHTKPKPGQTSLIIVFDGTGSMENCLIQLRAGAKQIIDKFANSDDNPIYNYIFVPFRDPRKINHYR